MDKTLHMKRGLGVTGDMSNYALEDLGLVRGSAQIGIEVLELDLFAPEVVAEAAKRAALVLVTIFIVELVAFDSFSHLRRVFI